MKPKIESIHYDENVDHLTIYKSNEKIVKTIDTGLVLLSLNKKKQIVGLEYMGAYKNFHIPEQVLRNIKGCQVELHYDPHNKFIVINLALKYPKPQSPLTFTSHTDLGRNSFHETFGCEAVV